MNIKEWEIFKEDIIQMKWISAKTPPESDGEVIVTEKCDSGEYRVRIVNYYADVDVWEFCDEVTAWMPLPETYKEGELCKE